jgi:hypothetical protein
MDAFSYLSVLFSIILGLAIAQVLQGYRAMLLARARVGPFWPSMVWSANILLIAAQSWWASFGLAHYRDWTFVVFAVLLLQTVLLYMMAALVLPDVPPGGHVDLAAHYRREVTPFFGLLLGLLATSLGKDILLAGHLPSPANLVFHGVFAAAAVLALANRRDWVHRVVAAACALLMLAYVGALFAKL